MTRIAIAGGFAAFALLTGSAWAKLPPPPPPDEKAKAAEVKAKTDEASKKDAEALAKYQDRAAENYKRTRAARR